MIDPREIRKNLETLNDLVASANSTRAAKRQYLASKIVEQKQWFRENGISLQPCFAFTTLTCYTVEMNLYPEGETIC